MECVSLANKVERWELLHLGRPTERPQLPPTPGTVLVLFTVSGLRQETQTADPVRGQRCFPSPASDTGGHLFTKELSPALACLASGSLYGDVQDW